MAPAITHWTADLVRALPDDGKRYEVVDGELLVTPAPSWQHQRAAVELFTLLRAYLTERSLGYVEILSPGTARADRIVKRRLYQSEGVPEYWIVDVDARLVERWRPGDARPEIVTDRLEWRPDPARPALEVELAAYFAEVYGE